MALEMPTLALPTVADASFATMPATKPGAAQDGDGGFATLFAGLLGDAKANADSAPVATASKDEIALPVEGDTETDANAATPAASLTFSLLSLLAAIDPVATPATTASAPAAIDTTARAITQTTAQPAALPMSEGAAQSVPSPVAPAVPASAPSTGATATGNIVPAAANPATTPAATTAIAANGIPLPADTDAAATPIIELASTTTGSTSLVPADATNVQAATGRAPITGAAVVPADGTTAATDTAPSTDTPAEPAVPSRWNGVQPDRPAESLPAATRVNAVPSRHNPVGGSSPAPAPADLTATTVATPDVQTSMVRNVGNALTVDAATSTQAPIDAAPGSGPFSASPVAPAITSAETTSPAPSALPAETAPAPIAAAPAATAVPPSDTNVEPALTAPVNAAPVAPVTAAPDTTVAAPVNAAPAAAASSIQAGDSPRTEADTDGEDSLQPAATASEPKSAASPTPAIAQSAGQAMGDGGTSTNSDDRRGSSQKETAAAKISSATSTQTTDFAAAPTVTPPPAAAPAVSGTTAPAATAPTRSDRQLPPQIEHVAQTVLDKVEAGGGEARIRLDPGNLGEVVIHVRTHGSHVEVSVQAETPQAQQLLRDSATELNALLVQRGLSLADLNIGGGQGNGGQNPQDGQPSWMRNGRGNSNDFANILGIDSTAGAIDRHNRLRGAYNPDGAHIYRI
ncbi:hypothetical protein AYO38_02870 [bacterium SCGC AG-212-C10]|nr:hypothetical protein AYO38_02870 [bacterium SCGC AG-212-C10]